MPGLPASLTRSVRNALRPLIVHTYTRVQPGEPTDAVDEDYQQIPGDETRTSGLPCLYMSLKKLVSTQQGAVLQDVPTLTVYHDDALDVGWRVENVLDKESRVLVTSGTVTSFDPSAESGASALKVAVLRVSETEGP